MRKNIKNCVTDLCVKELSVKESRVKGLCVKELCVAKLCVKELCVTELRLKELCVCDTDVSHCVPKCHACHTKGTSMSPNAMPATQNAAAPQRRSAPPEPAVSDKIVCERGVWKS